MSARIDTGNFADGYWSDTYRGRQIATFRHNRGWLVYLDRIQQQNKVFPSAELAADWLRREIDTRAQVGSLA